MNLIFYFIEYVLYNYFQKAFLMDSHFEYV